MCQVFYKSIKKNFSIVQFLSLILGMKIPNSNLPLTDN